MSCNCGKSKKYGITKAIKARLSGTMVRASDTERRHRLSICSECPYLIFPTWNCKKCGCFMHEKVKHLKASCPIGKW